MQLSEPADSDREAGAYEEVEGFRDVADASELSDCALLAADGSSGVASGRWLAGPAAALALFAGALLLAGLVTWRPDQQPLQAIVGRNEMFGDVTQEAHPPLCTVGQLPDISGPDMSGPAMQVNIMTYNLFWWQLFDHAQGPIGHLADQGNSATKLISKAISSTPYDVIGFTECEDEQWLLTHAGMAQEYTIFRDRACCMAYRTKMWSLVGRGVNYVADDARFGMRPAQWMRLRHKQTGKILFFVNHHGPLPISSGGMCGGYAHAFNIMKVFQSHSQRGDTLVAVGDFNSDPASVAIKLLSERFHVVNGGWKSKTHIDYIFSNVDASAVVRSSDLGPGGSDHDALHATLRIGSGSAKSEPPVVESFKSAGHQKSDLANEGLCSKEREDRFEYGINYIVASGSGRLHFEGYSDQEQCCLKCRAMPKCKSFTFSQGGVCWIFGALPSEKQLEQGTVSGLPLRQEERVEVYAEEMEESAEVKKEESLKVPSGEEVPVAAKRQSEYDASYGQSWEDEASAPAGTSPSGAQEHVGALRPSLPMGSRTPSPLPAPSPTQLQPPSQGTPAFHLSLPKGQVGQEPDEGLAGLFAPLTRLFHWHR